MIKLTNECTENLIKKVHLNCVLMGYILMMLAHRARVLTHFCLFSACCQLALEYGIKFMETSAKANINVENVSSDFPF